MSKTKTAPVVMDPVVDGPTQSALVPVDPSQFGESSGLERYEGEPQGTQVPWVGFRGAATKSNLDSLNNAGIEVNQFYLFDQEPIKIKPFQYHLIQASRIYAKHNSDGSKIVGASKVTNDKLRDEGYRSLITALVFVVMKSTNGSTVLVPAIMSLRGALDRALLKGQQLFDGQAKDPSLWASRSPAHAIASTARWPGGRFRITAWGSSRETTDGANKYNLGHCAISPTPADGVAAFNYLTDGEGYREKFLPAYETYQKRLAFLDKIVQKTQNES